jgi:acyl-lipid omega-6 desaturase (Delta-12 desaturase)
MRGIKKLLVRVFREPVVFFFVTVPLVWFVLTFYSVAKRYGLLSLTFLEKVMSVVVFTWVVPLLGVSALKMWVSIYLSSIMGTVLFHLQHSVNVAYRERQTQWNFVQAAMEGSTFLNVPFLLRPFTNGIEYHHIHHLNTNIASYVIDDCHERFDAQAKDGQKWNEFKINRVDIQLAFKSLFNVMFDEENSVLVPFDYTL